MIEQTGRESGSYDSGFAEFDDAPSTPANDTNPRSSFESLLETMCERLEDTNQQGALKRIGKLEKILDSLQKELDELCAGGNCSEPL